MTCTENFFRSYRKEKPSSRVDIDYEFNVSGRLLSLLFIIQDTLI